MDSRRWPVFLQNKQPAEIWQTFVNRSVYCELILCIDPVSLVSDRARYSHVDLPQRRFRQKEKDQTPSLDDLTLGRPATPKGLKREKGQRIHPKQAKCWRARRRPDLPRRFAFAQVNEIVHSPRAAACKAGP